MSSKNYMIDLFSGCGGFSYGFEQAGFECLVGVDQDGAALQPSSITIKMQKHCNWISRKMKIFQLYLMRSKVKK